MQTVATLILEDKNGNILLYLRDNKPNLPFPNQWDLFGGHTEKDETPFQTLRREIKEELDLDLEELNDLKFFREYRCLKGDVRPNIKHVYAATLMKSIDELTLGEGQRMKLFKPSEIPKLKIANILKDIILDYLKSKNEPEFNQKI